MIDTVHCKRFATLKFTWNLSGSHGHRGDPYPDAPASRDAGASQTAFPRWRVGMSKQEGIVLGVIPFTLRRVEKR